MTDPDLNPFRPGKKDPESVLTAAGSCFCQGVRIWECDVEGKRVRQLEDPADLFAAK